MNIDNKLLADLPQGYYLHEELRFMAKLVTMTEKLKGSYLEIGCLAGRTSVVIGLGARENNSQLFCIDIWDSGEWSAIAKEIGERASAYPSRPKNIYDIFATNMKRFELQNVVVPIISSSQNVLRGWLDWPLRFIHIDGCHEYEFVKKDIEWRDHLVMGGIICFHDYHESWPGVKKAIDECFNNNKQFKREGQALSLMAFRRIAT